MFETQLTNFDIVVSHILNSLIWTTVLSVIMCFSLLFKQHVRHNHTTGEKQDSVLEYLNCYSSGKSHYFMYLIGVRNYKTGKA